MDGEEDHSLEYRVVTPDGEVIWIRDLIHVVRGAQGPRQLRGLMVDVTERKRAEQALQQSERKYSEAFRREREASQRLRALDEMKNTFLEAVSHDLRTPLTSILGSALTLEQAQLDLPQEDALDLLGRIAANARKLERLLSDLLDLDRLQRGIVSPQRRPTDLQDLIRRGVAETENHGGHVIEVEVEPVIVSVDGAKVERIFENLLSNAIRHTPPDTRIWVRATAGGRGRRAGGGGRRPGSAARAARGRLRTVPSGAGLGRGALAGRRRGALARPSLRRAPRRPRVAGGPPRRRRVVQGLPARRVAGTSSCPARSRDVFLPGA